MKRILSYILILTLISCVMAQDQPKDTTGIGSLLTQIQIVNDNINNLRNENNAKIEAISQQVKTQLDNLATRVVLACLSIQLFFIGLERAVKMLVHYQKEKKRLKEVEKIRQQEDAIVEKLNQVIGLLAMPNAVETLKEAQKEKPKKKFSLKGILLAVLIGVTLLLTYLKIRGLI